MVSRLFLQKLYSALNPMGTTPDGSSVMFLSLPASVFLVSLSSSRTWGPVNLADFVSDPQIGLNVFKQTISKFFVHVELLPEHISCDTSDPSLRANSSLLHLSSGSRQVNSQDDCKHSMSSFFV